MQTTPNYNLPLPHPEAISAKADVQKIRDALIALDTALANLTFDGYTQSQTDDAINQALSNVYDKSQVDAIANQVKDDLLGGAGSSWDTLQELVDEISNNNTTIGTLSAEIANKADLSHTHPEIASGGPSLGNRSVIRYNELVIKSDITVWGANAECTADAGADTINKGTDDSFADGDIVYFETTGTLPAGLTAITPYYVRDIATNSLKVAASGTGAAIDITDTGTGTHTIYKPVNGSTVGPIEIADGVTVTVKDGSTWSVL